MISMRYAKNFVSGYGLVWNAGEYVEGYTNFLWVIWMSFLHLLPFHESKISLLVSLSGVIILILNLLVVKSIAEKVSNNSFITISLSMIFTAFYFGLIYWTLRGMEVGIITLLVSYSVLLIFRLQDYYSNKNFIKLITSLACILLLRMDSIVIIIFFLGFFYFTVNVSIKNKLFFTILFAMLFVFISQTIFRLVYYDDWLPNTYYLKLGGISLYNRLYRGSNTFVNIFAARLIPLFIPVILYLIFYNREIDKRKIFCMLGLFVITSVYSIYVGGDSWEWMPYTNRFITISIPAVIIVFSLSMEKLFLKYKSQKIFFISISVFLIYILTILLLFGNTVPDYEYIPGKPWINKKMFMTLSFIFFILITIIIIFKKSKLSESKTYAALTRINLAVISVLSFFIINEYSFSIWSEKNAMFVEQDTNNARLGLRLNSNTSEDTRIADLWAGNTPYFSNRYSIDLLGKTDKHIAKGKTHEDFNLPGHSKWDHLYSITEHQPDIILSLKEKPEGELKEYLKQYYVQKEPSGWYIKKETKKIYDFF